MRWTNDGYQTVSNISRVAFSYHNVLSISSSLHHMPQRAVPDRNPYIALLKGCKQTKDLVQGRILHDLLIKNASNRSLIVSNFLVDFYNSCGSFEEALHEFAFMPERNVYSWTIIISACIQHEQCLLALQFFRQMQVEGVLADAFTYSSFLGSFVTEEDILQQGKTVHACVLASGFHTGTVVLTSIINMYGKCGKPEIARVAFDAITAKDAICWNSMIAAYAHHEQPKEALKLYHEMQQNKITPSNNTFTSILRACSSPEFILDGKRIHADIVDGKFGSDLVKTSLVSMYSNCGSLEEAKTIFDEIHHHDVVSLNAMLGAFVQHDHGNDAINLYGHMWKMEIEPSPATLVSILSTCSLLGSTTRGKKIHMLVVENRSEADSILATAVVHMYGKCGQLSDAWAVFNRTKVRDPISWNAILNAYAQNGDDEMVLELFKEMLRDGVKPDKVTYISVLYACSHSGSVGNAQEYFDSMQKIYGLEPNTKHYACMIDLFGRAGLIEEAENFLRKMPIEPDTIVLTAYSGACRVHNDSIRGKWAAERLMDLDPHLESPYITLSNIYAAEGRWENVEGIRRKMEENVQNRTGRSWIEVDNFVHEFVSADCSHPQLKDIHGVLHHLGNQLKKAGYAKMEKNVFIDADTLSNNDVFCRHSEMLAIGFGFLKVPSGKSIRIFKNLPICPDCHAASGALSKLFDRNIVVRDTYRFHHFVDGSCSCGDYF